MSTATHTESEIDPLKHLGLARTFEMRFRDRGLESDDLMQEATIALIHASREFKPELDFKFSTFAGKCILNQLISTTRKSGDWKVLRRDLSGDSLVAKPAEARLRPNVSRYLDCLTEIQATVIRLRFGLDREPLTVAETAKVVERSTFRVRQIQIQAIRRIRKTHGIEAREVA